MQDTTFKNAVLNLRDVQKDQLFAQLHAVFSAINSMSFEEALSSCQTLNLMEKMVLDREAKAFLDHFMRALKGHMDHLADSHPSVTERVSMRMRITRVTSVFF